MFILKMADQSNEAALYPDRTVLDSLESGGFELIPVGCRRGGCGLCKIKILEGNYHKKKMSRAHISPKDESSGCVLACRIIPQSNLLIEQFDSENTDINKI